MTSYTQMNTITTNKPLVYSFLVEKKNPNPYEKFGDGAEKRKRKDKISFVKMWIKSGVFM